MLKILTEFLLRIPFYVIGQCSLVPTSHWQQGKCARINLLQAASGMVLQNHMRLPESMFSVKIAALGSMFGLLGRFSKLVSNFKGASCNFEFDF
jgi:hypothetical protein